MLFNSQIFIFVFLPVTLIGWYVLNKFKQYKLSLVFLIGMSLWFYGYFNPSYLIILVSSLLVNYSVSFLIERFSKHAKSIYILGLLFNLLLLGYFKYYDFFIENINFVFKSSFALKHILLPLGISFFTLQQISYITDRYWNSAPHYNIIEYAAYVTYFPQLIAGPIVLHSEIVPQYRDLSLRKFNKENFRNGLTLFILGLAKKVIIADTVALVVNYGFDRIYWIDTPSAWLVALGYTFELYFDFSGYCDMAVGLGRMFNFELPNNFDSPYKSHSIPEYWNRWHATLNRFFRYYIYNPIMLRGIRKGKKKQYLIIAPMVVFFISGFWHGASWTFVIWGILQGFGMLWCQRSHLKTPKSWRFIPWFFTFIFTVITQAIFRSETIDNMVRILKGMFTFTYTGFMRELATGLDNDILVKGAMRIIQTHVSIEMLYWLYFAILLVLYIICALILRGKNAPSIVTKEQNKGYTVGFTCFLALILAWSVISLSQVSTFLYFNF